MHPSSLSPGRRRARWFVASLLAAATCLWVGTARAAVLDRLTLVDARIDVVLDSDQAGTRARNLYDIYNDTGFFNFTLGQQGDRFGGTFASGAYANQGGNAVRPELQEAAFYWSLSFRVERTSEVYFRASRHLDILGMVTETVSSYWSGALALGVGLGDLAVEPGYGTPRLRLEDSCAATPTGSADSCLLNQSRDETVYIGLGTLSAGHIVTFFGYQEAVADSRIAGCSLVFCGADATAVGNSSLRWELTAVPEAASVTLFGFALASLALARAFRCHRRVAVPPFAYRSPRRISRRNSA